MSDAGTQARVPINDYPDSRVNSRRVDEFVGMCRATAAKPTVTLQDAVALYEWFEWNRQTADEPLASDVYDLLADVLEDGQLSDDEADRLIKTLRAYSGTLGWGGKLESTNLPLTVPPPEIVFQDHRFCFSGTFAQPSYTRYKCEQSVRVRGGTFGNIAACTDYLVIGSHATNTWKHASYGNKIRQAVRWQSKGNDIAIVSEEHFLNALGDMPHPNSEQPKPNGSPHGAAGQPNVHSHSASEHRRTERAEPPNAPSEQSTTSSPPRQEKPADRGKGMPWWLVFMLISWLSFTMAYNMLHGEEAQKEFAASASVVQR